MHMPTLRIAAALTLAMLVPATAGAQAFRTFGDWSLACDNVRLCTAIGYSAPNAADAYLRVTRGAGPAALPVIDLAVTSEGPARRRKLVVFFHRRGQVDIVLGPLDALSGGHIARARIPAGIASVVATSLREATSITLRLVDRPQPDETGMVLLHGSTAALLAMDEHQGRLGTMTALIGFGRGPASSVAREDALPAVEPKPMTLIGSPGHPGINPLGRTDPNCENAGEVWLQLGHGRQIRGICSAGGPGNLAYRFYDADTRPLRVIPFRFPWTRAGAGDDELVNPSLSADGLILHSLAEGNAAGTCGEAADWIWDGSAFRLFRFSAMRDCRGITSSDWPVLYRAWMR
jgi:hypothetical protein